jgi:cyclopropane fatty-acyl-phospholipid synthase-like methyltransferase
MKLHLCCGDVYLVGYINCDISGEIAEPGMTGTTLENYYKDRHIGTGHKIYIDKRISILDFPWYFADESIDEIVMIEAIEHFTLSDAKKITKEMHRILKAGGKLLIDFPDAEETIHKYIEMNPDYCMRLIYGSQRDGFSWHRWGYTELTFMELMGDGWRFDFHGIVKHEYPTIGCEAVKK